MIGDDEIILSGKYKDFDFNVHYDLKNASEKDVAYALCEVVKGIEPFAFKFAGVDCKKVDALAANAGKDLKAIAEFIRKTPIRKQLESSVKDPKLVPAAENYFFNKVFANAGIAVLPETASSIRPVKELNEGRIVFVGKYKEWAAIKKLALADAEEWEVAGILSSAIATAMAKAFQFSGCKEEINMAKSRKSFNAAADLLESLAGKMSSDKTKNAYLLVKSLEVLGYSPHANLDMLVGMYPDLKPKKPRGRMAKG